MKTITMRKAEEAEVRDLDWGRLTWLASGALGNAAGMTVGQCMIKPGCENPPHSHPNCEEILVVLRGRIAHSTGDGQSVNMEEGDTIVIPPNIKHNARNTGTEPALLMISFSSPDRKTQGE